MIEKMISRKLMYKGSIVSFYRDDVKIGEKITQRDVCVLNDKDATIQAFCYDNEHNIYMVSQYRHVKQKISTSCVGGYVEKDEPIEKALIREVQEELGAKVLSHKKIFSLNPLVAYTYEQTHYYLVEIDSKQTSQNLDEFEDLWIEKKTLTEFLQYANSKECNSLNVKIFANYIQLFGL